MSAKTKLSDRFAAQMSLANIPEWEIEHYFHPTRRWRFDYAWPDQKIAVEINGGTFMAAGVGHRNGAHLHGEYEKLNVAQTLGWVVLQFDTKHVSTGEALTMLFDAMASRGLIRTQLNAGEFTLKR